ncbi:MAG: hypothetical protein HY598_00040 [Candidatus Omnitrophica bacterium]|nr:hypothetical protein [Candidatus Omnitrophota bacterium]
MRRQMRRFENEQGAVLVVVTAAALVCSALAYGALYLTVAKTRRAHALKERAQVRYAAEAAMVWAMQQLWNDPAWSAPGGIDLIATLSIPAIPGISELTVRYAGCAAPPCPPGTLTVVARN